MDNNANQQTETAAPQPTGNMNRHPIGLWFFFWGEFAERASFYGMRAIVPLYLTSILGYSDADGGERYYWFKMASYFLPLVGGIVADRWLGRYWTIIGFSIPYVIGHFVLGIETQFWCMFALFLLLAPGTGVIKPNISSLLGETYDQQRPGQEGLRSSAFQFFYFAINIGALISMFVVPIMRNKYGYATAFQLPAWLMVGALAIFALGKPYYAKEVKREKTPEERREQNATLGLFFVIILAFVCYFAAAKQADVRGFLAGRFEVSVPDWAYYSGIGLAAVAILFATVKVFASYTPEMRRTLTRLFGIFGLIVFWWVAYEHNDSVWVFFARDYMHHNDTTFTFPAWLPNWLGGGSLYEPRADSYGYINSLFVLVFIPVFNGLFRAIDPRMKVFTSVRKILIGLLLTAAASGVMMYAAQLAAGGTARVSALWMVLAYIILTAGEVLVYGTMLDLSYAAAPKSMKGFITACFLLTNTLGNFINSILVPRTYGGSLIDAPETRGALSPVQFFAMSAGIVLVATVAFYFVGKRYERAQKE